MLDRRFWLGLLILQAVTWSFLFWLVFTAI